MTVPKSVRSWVADAEAAYGDGIDVWFPQDFGWREFCADAPDLATNFGERWAASTAAAGKARLEELSQSAFRGGYVGALALLAAFDLEASPDEALERLVAPLHSAEQDALSDSLADDLANVERMLNDEAPDGVPAPRCIAAVSAARAVRPAMREILAEGLSAGAKALTALGASSAAMSKVLSGIVNVAVGMAGLRYALAAEVDEDDGRTPLQIDRETLRTAVGDPEGEGDDDDDDEDDDDDVADAADGDDAPVSAEDADDEEEDDDAESDESGDADDPDATRDEDE